MQTRIAPGTVAPGIHGVCYNILCPSYSNTPTHSAPTAHTGFRPLSYMFGPEEMQKLISGDEAPIDVADMRAHVSYSGGYSAEHPSMLMFWRIVESLEEEDLHALVRYVTSCSRPPLLGFKDLEPPLCIHSAGRQDRLPTASTCMNLLKLPEYEDEETMRKRLLYAIHSGAGFELS